MIQGKTSATQPTKRRIVPTSITSDVGFDVTTTQLEDAIERARSGVVRCVDDFLDSGAPRSAIVQGGGEGGAFRVRDNGICIDESSGESVGSEEDASEEEGDGWDESADDLKKFVVGLERGAFSNARTFQEAMGKLGPTPRIVPETCAEIGIQSRRSAKRMKVDQSALDKVLCDADSPGLCLLRSLPSKVPVFELEARSSKSIPPKYKDLKWVVVESAAFREQRGEIQKGIIDHMQVHHGVDSVIGWNKKYTPTVDGKRKRCIAFSERMSKFK